MTRKELRDWTFALALGAAGGGLFALLDLPLPWMMGSMTVVTTGAVAGLPLRVPMPLRASMIAVLGLMLGSAFTPRILEHAAGWTFSLAAQAVFIVLITVVGVAYFRRLGHGPATSYFSAAPGGINEMILTGAAMGGDDRVISLTHSLRILIIVFAVPFWFRLSGGYAAPPMARVVGGLADLGLADAAWLVASAAAGTLFGRVIRLPAPALTGSMLISAVAHLLGWTTSAPPAELVAAAQVVTGTAIGCRFCGLAVRRLAPLAATALGSTVMMLAASALAAALLASVTGLPGNALLLALVPGGLAEMCLISLALGIDVAFVSTHHVARILLVVILAPTAYRVFRGKM